MYFRVANHIFAVTAKADAAAKLQQLMENYVPFAINMESVEPLASFCVDVADDNAKIDFFEETCQLEEGQKISCGKTTEGLSVFEFSLGSDWAGTVVCSMDFREAWLHIPTLNPKASENYLQRFGLNNALMVLYALATSCENTALFHSAVVTRNGVGYMFLGKSGTGKSTHARMWLSRFKDVELLNDDNPVVRLEQDGIWVYGSPWSGKTPCYKNSRVKIAGIVDLSQAPENKIRPINGIEAYMALVVSISGMRWNKKIADGLHATENRLAQGVPMFHLECLPNEEAAEVCYAAF